MESMTSQPRPRTVVAAIDFDEAGAIALREAARLTAGGDLHVVHVLDAAPARSDTAIERVAEDLREVPARIRRYLTEQGVTGASFAHVRVPGEGDVAEAIQQLAVDVDADVIVVGAHDDEGALHRLLHASVAEALARRAHCPVVVARPKDYHALSRSPRIEPPCPDCVRARRESGGAVWWCAEHQQSPRARAHRYTVDTSVGDSFFDSNVIPTGVKMF